MGSRGAGWAGHRALAGAARSFGAEIRTGAAVARIRVTPGGQVTGVTLASGEEVDAGLVVATAQQDSRTQRRPQPRVTHAQGSWPQARGRQWLSGSSGI